MLAQEKGRAYSPINWRIFAIPDDARIVLRVREGIGQIRKSLESGVVPSDNYRNLLDRFGKVPQGFLPVLDFMILEQTPEFDTQVKEITQPFIIVVPTPILRVLARL